MQFNFNIISVFRICKIHIITHLILMIYHKINALSFSKIIYSITFLFPLLSFVQLLWSKLGLISYKLCNSLCILMSGKPKTRKCRKGKKWVTRLNHKRDSKWSTWKNWRNRSHKSATCRGMCGGGSEVSTVNSGRHTRREMMDQLTVFYFFFFFFNLK